SGRAFPLHGTGRRFDPVIAHHPAASRALRRMRLQRGTLTPRGRVGETTESARKPSRPAFFASRSGGKFRDIETHAGCRAGHRKIALPFASREGITLHAEISLEIPALTHGLAGAVSLTLYRGSFISPRAVWGFSGRSSVG